MTISGNGCTDEELVFSKRRCLSAGSMQVRSFFIQISLVSCFKSERLN